MILLSIPLLYARSAAAAQAFYCRSLGFHLEFSHRLDPGKDDPCYMGVSRDGIWLHLSSYGGDGVAGNVANLIVDNVDEIFEEYSKRGVPIDTPPTDQTWGSREMYIKDPSGNSLRFIQPKMLQAEQPPEQKPEPAAKETLTSKQAAEWR
jgi:uncharacterized glyoxalase superfamily protein PhnB